MPFFLILAMGSIFISDIFSTYNANNLNFFLTLIIPIFLFLLTKIKGKKIFVPAKETLFYLLFMVFSVISTFFAIDKQVAFENLLLYGAGYLFFIFSFNHQKEVKKIVKPFLMILSILAILAFSINNFFKLNFFNESSSLFYSYGHNQIGNLLVLGFIPFFPNLLSLLFLIFILLSYSRTAYLASILIIVTQTFKNIIEKKLLIIGTVLVLIIGLFYFLISKNILFTKNKEVFGARNIYFSYALSSIKEKPLFGVGPGNFYFVAVKKQVNFDESTTSAHDIILDIMTENGILAGLFFLAFFLQIIYKRKNDNNSLLFLTLSFMFMIDFSYRFNFFLILWFVLAGLVLDSKKKVEMDMTFPIIIIFIGTQIIIFGQILLSQGRWRESLIIYPLQKQAYKAAITENIKQNDQQQTFYYLEKYNQSFGQSFLVLLNQANYYELLGKQEKALLLRKKALQLRPLDEINLGKILEISIDIEGEEKGKKDFSILLKTMKKKMIIKENSDLFKLINIFCREEKLKC